MFPDNSNLELVFDKKMLLLMEKLSQGNLEYLLWCIQQRIYIFYVLAPAKLMFPQVPIPTTPLFMSVTYLSQKIT